jgi:hypothetical protein
MVVEKMDKPIPQHAVNVKELQICRNRFNIDAILEGSVLTNLNDKYQYGNYGKPMTV